VTKVIGLCGPAGSGKSTAAGYLARVYGAKVYAFATPLKQIVGNAFNLAHRQLYGTQTEKDTTDERYNVSPRWLMQRVGTDGIRAVLGETFWAELTLKEIRKDRPKFAVIEDVRFESEATSVRFELNRGPFDTTVERLGYVWRFDNPWYVDDADHPSESEWAKCPYDHSLAPVEKTPEALYRELDQACKKFGIYPHIFDAESI